MTSIAIRRLHLLLFCLAASACQVDVAAPSLDSQQQATRTRHAIESLIASTTHIPSSPTPLEPVIVTPVPTLTLAPSPTPTIFHYFTPDDPPEKTSALGDRDSSLLADQNRTLGDQFEINLFERPLTAEEMVYVPYIDIAPGAQLSLAPPWVYVSISLVEAPPKDADVIYAVELDLDVDGRGDWLITAAAPHATAWTTSGVRAFLDANADIGGETASLADPQPPTGDGYETLIFDQGYGSNPDGAWVRLSPGVQPQIQIAFLHELIGEDKTFLWGVWADGGVKEPGWFDYNDHFTISQAGSPDITNRHYPLQELALVDNTCRWVQGIVPRLGMPGHCMYNPLVPTTTPRPPAIP